MNLSVMMYPGQYTQMYQYIKDVLYKGRTGKPFDVSVGVCLNFNKLLGMDYLEKPADLEGYNVPRIVQLLNTVDHVGISNYPSVRAEGCGAHGAALLLQQCMAAAWLGA
jgi:hypothetical protein